MAEYYDGFCFNVEYASAINYYRDLAQPVIDRIISGDFEIENMNQAIEAYSVLNCLKIYKKSLTSAERENLIYRTIDERVSKYAKNLTVTSIISGLEELSWQYHKDFWNFIVEYKIATRLNSSEFSTIINGINRNTFHELLQCKKLVQKFGSEIAGYMKRNPDTIEYILSFYFTNTEKRIIIPKTLTQDDLNQMMKDYISLPDRNMNYLKIIVNSHKNKDVIISDRIKAKAKTAYEEDWSRHSQSIFGVNMGAEVGFGKAPDNVTWIDSDGVLLKLNFNSIWLEENLDYPTLLNNFIYLFGFTDLQFRSNFCSHPAELGTLEEYLGIRAKKEYKIGASFLFKSTLFSVEMAAYCFELERREIYIEDVIKWFFEQYLKEEFAVMDYKFRATSHETSIAEKCTLIAKEIDSVLKQFTLYVEDGYIDRQLFEISSGHEAFRNIPSMSKEKYGYLTGDDLDRAMYSLFSDQSLLAYTERTKDEYRTLYDLLKNDTVNYNEYKHFQTPNIDFLRDNKIIHISENGEIIGDFSIIELLHDFYLNEVVCLQYNPQYKEIAKDISDLCELKIENRLFTAPEQSYLNYILNKEESTNGLELRNSYCHGTASWNEETNRRDYYELLKVMVLIVIKINEEFCLRSQGKKNKR